MPLNTNINLSSNSLHISCNEKHLLFFNKYELNQLETDQSETDVKIKIFKKGLFTGIANFFTQLFEGKKILIHLDQKIGKNNQVYVKVSDLSKKLRIEKKAIIQNTKGKSAKEISSYLKREASTNAIVKLVPNSSSKKEEIRKVIKELSEAGITEENIIEFVKKELSEKTLNTLINLSNTLNKRTYLKSDPNFISIEMNQNQEDSYQYFINEFGIYIKNQDNTYKNLKTLQNEEITEKDIQGYNTNIDVINQLAEKFNVTENNNLNNVFSVAQRISYSTIIELLNTTKSDSEKKILFNTLIRLGEDIWINTHSQSYFEKKKINLTILMLME